MSAALLAFPTAATAAEAESDDSRTIIVTGKADGYFAENSVTATKTDTPLIDVPQTISVVTRERLDDRPRSDPGLCPAGSWGVRSGGL